MNRLLVLADDYTGALDTGVQFSGKGVKTLVLAKEQVSFDRVREMGIPVLAVDMESRHIPPVDAYRLVRNMASDAADCGFNFFYKKTDSALRGNIGAELAGLLDAGIDSSLSFVPAFPKSGRTTKNGIQYINGVEVARSVFANDPFDPVTHSSVADIISTQTRINFQTENMTKDLYPMAAEKTSGGMVRIFDAESMDDIAEIGRHLKRGGNLKLTAGCAGFAGILPELLELESVGMHLEERGGSALIVSGSLNPITVSQLSRGESIGFKPFTLTSQQKLDAAYLETRECENFVQNVAEEIGRNGRAILRTIASADEFYPSSYGLKNPGMPDDGISRRVSQNIGELTLRILNSVRVDNLVVFGGDTLNSILNKMRCEGVIPLFEIAPGVVAARVLAPDHKCVMITKSGGLGGDDVLDVIDGFLRRQ